jgi:hypothetical protein
MQFFSDDTILPTSWLRACGLLAGTIAEMSETAAPEMSESVKKTLAQLEVLAVDVIETCERLGTVVFVTNSSTLWIPFTVKRFFPGRLAACMQRFRYFSARPEEIEAALANPETAKNVYYVPSMGTQWKIERFKKVSALGNYNDFISIGDGYAERVAVLALMGKNTRAKAVRLDAQPSVELMIDQLIAMRTLMPSITVDARSGDVALFNDGFRLIPAESDENMKRIN